MLVINVVMVVMVELELNFVLVMIIYVYHQILNQLLILVKKSVFNIWLNLNYLNCTMFLVTEMLLTTSHPYPKYDESDQEAKKLQIIEAKKHSKFNT